MTDFLNNYVRIFQMGGRSPALQHMLLSCHEADFDRSIITMKPQTLVEVITSLQSEMRGEQANFDRLTKQLSTVRDKTSRQFKAISADLMSSQNRLTSLMNRSMKCFNQQSAKLSAISSPDIRRENGDFDKHTPQVNGSSSGVECNGNDRIRPGRSVDNIMSEVSEQSIATSRVRHRPSIQDLRKMFDAEDDLKRTSRSLIESVSQSSNVVMKKHAIQSKVPPNTTNSSITSNSHSRKIISVSPPEIKPMISETEGTKTVSVTHAKNSDVVLPQVVQSHPLQSVEKSIFTLELKTNPVKPTETRTISTKRVRDNISTSRSNIDSKVQSELPKRNQAACDATENTSYKLTETATKSRVKSHPNSDDPAINAELMAALSDLKKHTAPSKKSADPVSQPRSSKGKMSQTDTEIMSEDAVNTRRSSILDEDDIFSHSTATNNSLSVTQDSSDLLARSSSLLDQLRSRQSARLSMPSAVTTTTRNRSLSHLDDISDTCESQTGFKFMRKLIEVKAPEFSKPEYRPSSNIERARELMRSRYSSRFEQESDRKHDAAPLASRSSRLVGLKSAYGSLSDVDKQEPISSESRYDRLMGRSSLLRVGRSRFDSSSSEDSGSPLNKDSSVFTRTRGDATIDKGGDHSKLSNFRLKSDTRIANEHVDGVETTDATDGLAKDLFDDIASFVKGAQTNELSKIDSEKSTHQTDRYIAPDHSLEESKESKVVNGVGVLNVTNTKSTESSAVQYDHSSDSDEAVVTSEEVVYVVNENGDMLISHDDPRMKTEESDIFHDMPELEEDTSWKSEIDNIKTVENLVAKPNLSKTYSFAKKSVSPTSNSPNTESLENNKLWKNMEENKSSIMSPSQDFQKYQDMYAEKTSGILERVEQIKHNIQVKRDAEKEATEIMESIASNASDMSPQSGVGDELIAADHSSDQVKNGNVCESRESWTRPINSDAGHSSDNKIQEALPISDKCSQERQTQETLIDENCVEFVRVTSESPIAVFAHPMNGDISKAATQPRHTGSLVRSSSTEKAAVAQKMQNYMEPLKTQDVVIIEKLNNVKIPSVFKSDVKSKSPGLPRKNEVTRKSKVIPREQILKQEDKFLTEAIEMVIAEPANQNVNAPNLAGKPNSSRNKDDEKSEKKSKRPSVKAAIKKWEKRKSMPNLFEPESIKSLFDRLSQPKHRYEGPPLIRQPSGRRRSSLKSSNSGSGDSCDMLSSPCRRSNPDLSPSNTAWLPTNDFSDTDSVASSKSTKSLFSSSSASPAKKTKEMPGYMRPKKRQQRSTDEYLYGSSTPVTQSDTSNSHVKKHSRNGTQLGKSPVVSRKYEKNTKSDKTALKPPVGNSGKSTKVNGLSRSTQLLVTELLVLDVLGQTTANFMKDTMLGDDTDCGMCFVARTPDDSIIAVDETSEATLTPQAANIVCQTSPCVYTDADSQPEIYPKNPNGPNPEAHSDSTDVKHAHIVPAGNEVKATPPSTLHQPSVTGCDEVKGQEFSDELVQPRVHLTQWNPTKLLAALYTIRLMEETETDLSQQMITMEGFMEKLPMGKKKSTLLKTWKRRYFKTCDGMLHYYESSKGGQPNMSIKLMGGHIESLENRILGIDDSIALYIARMFLTQSGHYLMLRCPTEREFTDWHKALKSQTIDNSKAIYVRPVLQSPRHQSKKVVIVDLGSTSIRAGLLGQQASLPQVFFPTVVAIHKQTGKRVAGFDAYRPEIRGSSDLTFPVHPSHNGDRANRKPFNIDIDSLPCLFSKVYSDLNVDSSRYQLLLSTPQNFSSEVKEKVLDMLVRQFSVPAVCMVPQALLAIYSYKATSGVIVDVGERLEIMAITEGYVVEGSVTRKAYGSQKTRDSLTAALSEGRYHFYTPVEELLTRHVLEQSCYVSCDYEEDSKACLHDRQRYERVVSLTEFDLPPQTFTEVRHDYSTFRACEGFFNPSLWGADFPTLQHLVYKAIQVCPMDTRRDMARSIYLSGGCTMAPGFPDRLTKELKSFVPENLKVIVHASPQRYHAAYIGACTLADQKFFEPSCITRDEWLADGHKALQKWATPH